MAEADNFGNRANLLRSQLEKAREVLVVFSAEASLDEAALATTFYLALLAQKKNPTLLCLGEPLVAHAALVGIDQVRTKLPQTGLILNINNDQKQIGNISCDGDFNSSQIKIYVRASEGKAAPVTESITFAPLIANYEKILVIGRIALAELAAVGLTSLDEEKMTAIGREKILANSYFMSLSEKGTASYAALGTVLLRQWVWNVDGDMATNLLMGIDEATENLTLAEVRPEVFESVGWLVRCGGKRYLKEAKKRKEETKGWDLRRKGEGKAAEKKIEVAKEEEGKMGKGAVFQGYSSDVVLANVHRGREIGKEVAAAQEVGTDVLSTREGEVKSEKRTTVEAGVAVVEQGAKEKKDVLGEVVKPEIMNDVTQENLGLMNKMQEDSPKLGLMSGVREEKKQRAGEIEEKSAREVAMEHEREEKERKWREMGGGAVMKKIEEGAVEREESKNVIGVNYRQNDNERMEKSEGFKKTRDIINNRFKRMD